MVRLPVNNRYKRPPRQHPPVRWSVLQQHPVRILSKEGATGAKGSF